MDVLVTGAGGFVGKAIVEELLNTGFRVLQMININNKSGSSETEPKIFKADITDYQKLNDVFKEKKSDVLIHTAGLAHQFGRQKKEDFWKINVLGTENAAKLAASLKARHFILISSVAVYGSQPSERNRTNVHPAEITEETACDPQGIYAQSKYESEKIAVRICEANDIALTILRFATVFGEGDKGNVARLIRMIDGNRFVWIGRGENYKSLIHKSDAAKACVKIIGKTKGTEIYNVTGTPLRMKEIVAGICEGLGTSVPKLTVPPQVLKVFFLLNSRTFKNAKIENLETTVSKWLSNDFYSSKKFAIDYGFQAQTPIKAAIKRQSENSRQRA